MGGDTELPFAVRQRPLCRPHESYGDADWGFATVATYDASDPARLLCQRTEGKGKEDQEAEAYDMSE